MSIAKWRTYAGGGSGPRDPLGRRSSAFFCWVRPRARPPAPAFGVRCAPRTAIPRGIVLFALNLSSPPTGSATSSDELQSAAWGGGELRGSASRKSNAFFCQVHADRSLRGPQQRQLRASAAGGFGPRDPKGSHKHCPRPGQWNSIKHRPVSLRDALTGANRIFHPHDSPRRTAYETKNTLRLSEKWEKSSL